MADIVFVGQFVASKAGKTGLTVTVDVDRYTISDGSRSSLVTAGSATEGRRGLYHYRLASADLSLYQYVATFITADATVDQQEVAAIGLVVPDALVSSRSDFDAGTDTVTPSGGTINSVSGSVGSVSGLTAADVAAIKAVTDKLDTAMVLDGAVYQFTVNALELAASGGLNAAQTGDAVLDEVVEGVYTLRQMMRLVAAALAGASSGGGTTEVTFTGLDGSTPRIVATVDASGNRTAVTKTVT